MKSIASITFLGTLAAAVGACSEGRVQAHPPKAAQNEVRPIGTMDRLPDVPSKPEGGVDLKRKVPLSPEENMARIRRNAAYPVTFGVGAAGITLSTTLSQSLDLLSDPYGSNENQLYYKEGIIVPWSDAQPEKPEAIYVIDGYTGVFETPATFGELHVGGSAAAIFKEADAKGFLEAVGRQTMKKDAGYSCLTDKECKLVTTCAAGSDNVSGYQLIFPGGGLIINNDEQKSIEYAVITALPGPRTPAMKDAVDLTKGVGAVTIAMTKAEIEAKLGKPAMSLPTGEAMYDNENFVIAYDPATSKPAMMQVQKDYEGTIKITETLTVTLGKSMKEYFGAGDPRGESLIKEIGRFVEGKPVGYDCLKEKTCEIVQQKKYNIFGVKGAVLVIEPSCERKLMIVQLQAPEAG